jgi:hypothetical protein
MCRFHRFVAILELFLVFPAALFMTALFVRETQPKPYQPAQAAGDLVDWFAARPFLGLDILLILMPLAALSLGAATLLRAWRRDAAFRQSALGLLSGIRAQLAALLIAGATLAAGAILAIVAVHMIID